MRIWRRVDITGVECYIAGPNGCSFASPTSGAQQNSSSANSFTPSSALYPNTTAHYIPKPTDVVYGLLFILFILILLCIAYYAARPRRIVHKEKAWTNDSENEDTESVEGKGGDEKVEEIVSTRPMPCVSEPEIITVKNVGASPENDRIGMVRVLSTFAIHLDSVLCLRMLICLR
jgi:hypothetical protein